MLVLPAIDVSGGRLARLTRGELVPVAAFGGDPVAAAARFVADGARWLHVVDMDLALTGRVSDLGFLSSIAALGADVQASGGVGGGHAVEAMLGAGATRVVIGSAALRDPDALDALLARFGDRLVIGLELDGGAVRPRGDDGPALDLRTAMATVAGSGAGRILCTCVGRVGTLAGPDVEGLGTVMGAAPGVPVLAAGGIGSLSDIRALVNCAPQLEGLVLGTALYDGGMALADAMEAAR